MFLLSVCTLDPLPGVIEGSSTLRSSFSIPSAPLPFLSLTSLSKLSLAEKVKVEETRVVFYI